jgi:hypothetical protein
MNLSNGESPVIAFVSTSAMRHGLATMRNDRYWLRDNFVANKLIIFFRILSAKD